MDAFIDEVIATADHVKAKVRGNKRLRISFDEWNVWYQARFPGSEAIPIDVAGPRIEDVYSTVDAVVVGDLLGSLINHADRVKIGCLAQLVNVIAPIMTVPGGSAWRQATFHPFAAVANAARGHSLVTRVRAGELPTRRHGDVPALAAAATHDPDGGAAAVYLTTRASAPTTVELRHPNFPHWATQSAGVLAADQHGPRHQPEAAGIGLLDLAAHDDRSSGTTRVTLPPQSWAIVHASTNP
jgi:alpha-N-arabinofuranosidase